MNFSSSQKVMMGLSNSPNQSFDLINPQQEEQHHNRASASGDNGEGKEELKEEILPSYDFQSIRHILPPNPVDSPTNSSNVRRQTLKIFARCNYMMVMPGTLPRRYFV